MGVLHGQERMVAWEGAASRLGSRLSEQAVIFGVGADPEPDQIVAIAHAERPVVETDAHRPEAACLLEMQRRVERVRFQAREIAVGEIAIASGSLS
jgi:hypothetical protein